MGGLSGQNATVAPILSVRPALPLSGVCSKTVSHHLIHVDDIDTTSDNNEDVDYIYGQIHKRFGIPRCDPAIMLGVERRLNTVANTRYLEFLMPTYISNLMR